MATDFDITNLYQKWIELDRELKELRTEVNQLKWYAASQTQQHGTNGAVAYSGRTSPGMGAGGGNRYPDSDWEHNLSFNKPAQWPNEPYTDYLKRIGQYNEAMIYEDDSK